MVWSRGNWGWGWEQMEGVGEGVEVEEQEVGTVSIVLPTTEQSLVDVSEADVVFESDQNGLAIPGGGFLAMVETPVSSFQGETKKRLSRHQYEMGWALSM